MLFPTNMPLLAGLALFGLTFVNSTVLGMIQDQLKQDEEGARQ